MFFGESLGPFVYKYKQIVNEADLVIVMGTSLQVGPVNQLAFAAKAMNKPRILINNQVVGDFEKEDDKDK